MKEIKLSLEELRQKAIDLYRFGWRVSQICSTLGRSKSWFHKWLNRYNDKDESWFKDESRVPQTIPNRIDPEMEQLVVNTRKQLMSASFSQYGPQAIYYCLAEAGITPPPIWTIARILKRHSLVRHKRKGPYIPKGKKYPYDYCLCHQMDFVGPRYLASKVRFYFLNIIDCDTHWAHSSILDNQRAISVCECLVRSWKVTGIPDFLQMDNDLSFWGSLRNPRAVGKVIRLCLLHGVTPVFIPQSEPWRNGVIEHFNNTIQGHLLKDTYTNIEQLQKAAGNYDKIHNRTHYYSSQNGSTPLQMYQLLGYPTAPLDENYEIPDGDLPLQTGQIHIIRFIRSDLTFHLFGLSFQLPETAKYEYVRGVILTEEHRLVIFKDQEFITDFKFILL